MAFACIRKDQVDKFRAALKGKDIDVFKLMQMSTEERTAVLQKIVGKENVKAVNTLFEEKLILKNKIQGLKNWVSKVGEVGRYDKGKQAALEQLMSEYKARQQERMFNPAEEKQFLADLVEEKFGTRISAKEAKNVFDLQAKADELKVGFDEKTGTWKEGSNRLQYGAAEVAVRKYTESLKSGDLSVKEMLKESIQNTKESWKKNKPKTVRDVMGSMVKFISDNSVSMVASFDNSFMGRQGLKTLFTHPSVWIRDSGKSFKDIWNTLGGKNAKDALLADVYSRENYLNGEYLDAKLLPKSEEQFPTSLPERVPGIGRVYNASQAAFEGTAIRMRTDTYDLLKRQAIENGVKWDEAYVSDLGKLVGSLTAKGELPRNLGDSAVRLVLWAPKMLKANYDVLTGHTLGSGLETSFARKQAATNLVKIVATSAAIMSIANAMKPGSAETDPTSSNFGKIKVGNTTFDYTGGAASLIVLASRIITQQSKSASTGVKTRLNTGKYGATTTFDVLVDFLSGKTTPGVGTLIQFMKGRDFSGKKPTLSGAFGKMFTPIGVQNAIELKDDHSAQAVLGVILDTLGINTNTYIPETDWTQSEAKDITEFRDSVDSKTFNKANKEYNQRVNEWIKMAKLDPSFSTLSDEDKQKEITKQKKTIKEEVLSEFKK